MIRFTCNDETLTKAYEIALNDCAINTKLFKSGLLTEEMPCIIAGAGYWTPWTRDTAINVYNAFALLNREAAKNTLFSVLEKEGDDYYVVGQYWDSIIWAIGAYRFYTVTDDTEFLKIAQNALTNTLAKFEREEFDPADNLFRGPAVYGDGVAAYPDRYVDKAPSSFILSWLDNHRDEAASVGEGMPMKALSTNCVYYQAYLILAKINEILGIDSADALKKADALKVAINNHFWNEENGTYDYLAHESDYQEALGVAFALLFGVADDRQAELVGQNTYVTPHGITCVWPSFDRYLAKGGYGRHAGTVWPHAQGFWASACATRGNLAGFESELYTLANKAVRDGQFYEIYHPDTGEIYGGWQEVGGNDIRLSKSQPHQTWSATGYLSLVYYHILGAKIEKGSVTFAPTLPSKVNEAKISGFKVGNTTFDVTITRGGDGASTATYSTDKDGTVSVVLSV